MSEERVVPSSETIDSAQRSEAPSPGSAQRSGAPFIDESLPEPVRAFLRSGGVLERIRLDDEGRWWHQGEPFQNQRLAALFHRSIDRSPGGTWVLRVPPFVYPIEVADTPYHVRSLRREGGTILLRLSDDSEEPLRPETLAFHDRRGLSCAVNAGGGRFRARFNRPAFHAVCDLLEVDEAGGLTLRLEGRGFPIARE